MLAAHPGQRPFQRQRRHEACDITAQLRDLLDEAGRDELVAFAGHQEHRLHLVVQAVVHPRHLELVVEIGHRPKPPDDHASVDGSREVDQQPGEAAHLDLRARPGGNRGGLVPD